MCSSDLAGLEATLQEMNPDAPVLRASFGEVEPELLFPTGPRAEAPRGHAEEHHHHHEAFVSEELAVPTGWPEAQLLPWLEERRGLRTKGFVVTAEGPRIVQGVGRRLELQELGELQVDPSFFGRVVVIRARTA